MRAEILKILDLNKQGKITDDQAAELLAALRSEPEGIEEEGNVEEDEVDTDEADVDEEEWESEDTEETVAKGEKDSPVGEFTNLAFDGLEKFLKKVETTVDKLDLRLSHRDKEDNNTTLSKVGSITGQGYDFSNNNIQVSSVNNLV